MANEPPLPLNATQRSLVAKRAPTVSLASTEAPQTAGLWGSASAWLPAAPESGRVALEEKC
jgi:hypothetical protein